MVPDFKDLQSPRGAVKCVIKVNGAMTNTTVESVGVLMTREAWRAGDSDVLEEVTSELRILSAGTALMGHHPAADQFCSLLRSGFLTQRTQQSQGQT